MIFCKCAFLLKCEPVNFVMIDRWIDEGGKSVSKRILVLKFSQTFNLLLSSISWLTWPGCALVGQEKLKLIFLVFRGLCFWILMDFCFCFSDNNHLNFVLKEKEEEDKEGTERMDGSCVSTYDYFLIKCTIVIFLRL